METTRKIRIRKTRRDDDVPVQVEPVLTEIVRTKNGHPACWVGGGAWSNTCGCKFVLNEKLQIKPAIFVRRSGQLACEKEQALVHVQLNDIIVEVWGRRSALCEQGYDAGDLHVTAKKTIELNENNAVVEEININYSDIPDSVIDGLDIYHNRDGKYFINSEIL
jgi:hypothetical protein